MSDEASVRPARLRGAALPLATLIIGGVLGIGLDRAWIEFAPVLHGKPKLIGQWIGVSSNDPIEFNADGSYAWEIPIVDMSGGAPHVTGGNRQLSTWKWVDNKTIVLGRSSFGRQDVSMGVMVTGDLLRLSETDGSVKEYRRK